MTGLPYSSQSTKYDNENKTTALLLSSRNCSVGNNTSIEAVGTDDETFTAAPFGILSNMFR